MSEIEGINLLRKSVSVWFCVRVVRASGWVRRSGVGAYGGRASNPGGLVAKISAGPGEPDGRLLRRRKDFEFVFVKSVLLCKGFMQQDSSGCAVARVFKGMHL